MPAEISRLLGRQPKTQEDFEIIAFEASQLFTPSRPVSEQDLFAGRSAEIRKMLEATAESGKHVVLFGERGVGKTSLAKVFSGMFPRTNRHIYAVREQIDKTDTFSSIWKKVFKDILVEREREGDTTVVPLSQFYENSTLLNPDDVRRELEFVFREVQIPIIVLDEYDNKSDEKINEQMADLIKSLSDFAVNVTIVVVGIADNLNDLVGEHRSLQRCIEQVPMPRMEPNDLRLVIDKRIARLGMKMHPDALWKIVNLSRGLPAYVHMLGLYSVQSAARRRSTTVTENDVSDAIKKSIEKSQESIQDSYELAVHSNKPGNLYRQVLLSCALATTDDRGSFSPLAVCAPMSEMLTKDVPISAFQQHLKSFVTQERGNILTRKGRERAYRFRFTDPMMQPYVIMKGIEQGLVSPRAYEVLSYPAQTRLPI
jgi:Cdc6-like AAA superfamily ATPase